MVTDKIQTEKAVGTSKPPPRSRRIALSALLIALGVALSIFPGSIPFGPTRVLPYQHMVNVIGGILLGPWYAAGIALAVGTIRVGIGTGTVFAFPGGIPGALVVGLLYHYLRKSDLFAFSEPVGTGFGALISALIVQPMLGLRDIPLMFGLAAQWQLFLASFWLSSIPGAVMGFVIVVALRRRGVVQKASL